MNWRDEVSYSLKKVFTRKYLLDKHWINGIICNYSRYVGIEKYQGKVWTISANKNFRWKLLWKRKPYYTKCLKPPYISEFLKNFQCLRLDQLCPLTILLLNELCARESKISILLGTFSGRSYLRMDNRFNLARSIIYLCINSWCFFTKARKILNPKMG